MNESQTEPLLQVDHLRVSMATQQGIISPVRDVSFSIKAHETLGIIGESGCGKSVTVQAIMGLLSPRSTRVEGDIALKGRALHTLNPRQLRQYCGRDMAMIFQDPLSSLNPVFTLGQQIAESLRLHTPLSGALRRQRVVTLLEEVGIYDPARTARMYPHEISGGMRQRVMIAMAMASEPALLIADEPTTALDVTIQTQILALLDSVKARTGMGIVIITHDLTVIAQMCQRVLVMYLGQVVEEADIITLFDKPRHPYTQALLASRPSFSHARKSRLSEIAGSVPSLSTAFSGCSFADRCPYVQDRCQRHNPSLRDINEPGHRVRCWFAEKVGETP